MTLRRAALVLWVVACGGDSGDSKVVVPEKTPGALVGGTVTSEYPAVGYLALKPSGICTGTLVRPRVVLAAAHCYGWQSSTREGDYGSFVLESSPGTTLHSRKVIQVRSFGVAPAIDHRDVALALLDTAMPPDVAPQPLASAVPNVGTAFQQLGYGCQERPSCGDPKPNALGKKQIATGTWQSQMISCAGDSGGPLMVDGAVFGVSSGAYCNDTHPDVTGLVPPLREAIESAMREWGICDDADWPRCQNGHVCTVEGCRCPAPQSSCGGACVHTSVDRNHCGGCGNSCDTGDACVEGICKRVDCNGDCRREYDVCKRGCAADPEPGCLGRCRDQLVACRSECT